jgi:hypothetical protein
MELGGKVGNGGRLVAAVDGRAAVALVAQVQMVVVKGAAFWRRLQVAVFNGVAAVATGSGYTGGRKSNESGQSVWRRLRQQQQRLHKGSDSCGGSEPLPMPSLPSLDNVALVATATTEEDNADDGEAPRNDNMGRSMAATENIQTVCCCRASAEGAVMWIAVSQEDKTLPLYSPTSTTSSNKRERNDETAEEGRIQPPVT